MRPNFRFIYWDEQMKLIKFDLPIDGTKVKDLEELREHFSTEILGHYRSGLLSKWLLSRKIHHELTAVQALDGADEHALLKGLCGIFGVDIDDEIASAMLNKVPPKTEKNVKEQARFYDELAEAIDLAVYQAIRTNCITADYKADLRDLRDARTSELCWAPLRETYCKGDALFDKSSYGSQVSCAPAACKIVEKLADDEQKVISGDLLGWFMMSESAEDYFGNWHVLSSLLKHRKNLLGRCSIMFFSQNECVALKESIDRRVSIIQTAIDILDSCDLPRSGEWSQLFSGWNYLLHDQVLRDDIDEWSGPDDIKKLAKSIMKAREDLFRSFSELSPDNCKVLFFNKNCGSKVIRMHGIQDDKEDEEETVEIELCVNVGDRIFTNDIIATEKHGRLAIRSDTTGIVREILVSTESEVSNGAELLIIDA
jgi:hypothetical protein